MDPAAEYALARRALLDTLDILEPHRGALILVGAQAVYLHAPGGFGTAPHTTDADIAVDPGLLATVPEIASLLADAGYTSTRNPGGWESPLGTHIDLMVPDAVVRATTRRTAPLAGHESSTARRTPGLEIALVNHIELPIPALEQGDTRQAQLKVAGPPALVIAKLVKIRERLDASDPRRILPKDAADLLRLLRMCDAAAIGTVLGELSVTSPYGELIDSTLRWGATDVSNRRSRLADLAVAASDGGESPAQLSSAVVTLLEVLMKSYRAGSAS